MQRYGKTRNAEELEHFCHSSTAYRTMVGGGFFRLCMGDTFLRTCMGGSTNFFDGGMPGGIVFLPQTRTDSVQKVCGGI